MADTANPTDGPEATVTEDEEDYDALVGAPLDGDYLARLSQEADK
jgi:hypothetical protein